MLTKIILAMKKITLMLIVLIFSSCTSVVDTNQKDLNQQTSIDTNLVNKENKDSDIKENLSMMSSGYWTELGGNGSAIDIEAADKVWVVGQSNTVMYYNTSTSTWVNEPGGGSGKKISSAGNLLLLTGGSNKVYYKTKGSSSSWTQLGSITATEISGVRNATSLSNNSVYAIGTNNYLYKWTGSTWGTLRYPSIGLFNNYYVGVSHNFTPSISVYFSRIDGMGINYLKLYRLDQSSSSPTDDDFIANLVKDISVAPNGYIWFIRTDNKIGYIDNSGNVNILSSGSGTRISIANDGTPYIIGDSNGKIYYYTF
ncbi:MAG TPA: hypothetical protein DCE78_02180 [Bacteroidetes bacterium]|nr:hypothetical protein [Bacteroidota bacterium]